MSFNMSSSERTVYYADAVILCTGGHTRLWKKVHLGRMKIQGMDII